MILISVGVLVFSLLTTVVADYAAAESETALFAGGCFWCMQPPFDETAGVIRTTVGYAGGKEQNPTYRSVSAGKTGHLESIEVIFDNTRVSYEQLLKVFWHQINPTQANGQFSDIGHQYTTAIFYESEAQRIAAEASKMSLEASGKFDRPIATAIRPATRFWPAEDYHQKYYQKNPAHYHAYKVGSGRAGYIKRTWGEGR
jgi:methionine-S-sulfoxide reductase